MRELARTMLCLALLAGASLDATARGLGAGGSLGVGANVGGGGVAVGAGVGVGAQVGAGAMGGAALRGDAGLSGSAQADTRPSPSAQAEENSNGRFLRDRKKGLDRAAQRMSETGLSHEQATEAHASRDGLKALNSQKTEIKRGDAMRGDN